MYFSYVLILVIGLILALGTEHLCSKTASTIRTSFQLCVWISGLAGAQLPLATAAAGASETVTVCYPVTI